MYLLAVALYSCIILGIAITSCKHHQTEQDFVIGSRKLNFWVTALAAHASDMSSWIFMGYPAIIFSQGLFHMWIAVGLVFCMFLNWQFVAPRLRKMTEQCHSVTLPSFFEKITQDKSGLLRIMTVVISLIYYTIYISALLLGLGILLQTLFGLPYIMAISLGLLFVISCLLIGGYVTLAWTDFFQGIFLLLSIILVPSFAIYHIGGWTQMYDTIHSTPQFMQIIPDYSMKTCAKIFFLAVGWGLAYFGMPHIITKFMGIQNINDLPKSKWVGISWQIASLIGATLVGCVGLTFFSTMPLKDSQLIFINMTIALFAPFIAGFILCAILGTTLTSLDSQILVLASNLTEDLYKKHIFPSAPNKHLLFISRINVFLISITAYCIACFTSKSIFTIVSYAWFGLGSSFGPLVLLSLYTKVHRAGALAGICIGSLTAGIWPFVNDCFFSIYVPPSIPGFFFSAFTIWLTSIIAHYKILPYDSKKSQKNSSSQR